VQTARRLRDLAIDEYGCVEFISAVEGDEEIAVSYWESEQQILRWREDPEHVKAQEMGRKLWYKSCQVQICKIERDYIVDQTV